MQKIMILIPCIIFFQFFIESGFSLEGADQSTDFFTRYKDDIDSKFGFLRVAEEIDDFTPFEELGISWVRGLPGVFQWDIVEKEKGRYDFTKTDEYVHNCQEHGLYILAIIFPFAEWDQKYWRSRPEWTPSFMVRLVPTSRYKPHDWEAYGNFVTALVERYDGDGIDDYKDLLYPVKYWEVMNQPDAGVWSVHPWFNGGVDDYLEVLKACYGAVKTADSTAVIVQGGGTGVKSDKFWEEFYQKGGGKFIDLGNTHFINLNIDEDLGTTWWGELMDTFNIDGFYLTELNLAPIAIDPNPWTRTRTLVTLDYDEHANRIIKGCVWAFFNGCKRVFYTTYKALFGDGENIAEAALLDVNLQKKPAFYAYKTTIQMLDRFTSVEKLTDSQFKFIVEGKPVYVIWGKRGEKIVDEIKGPVRVTNFLGEKFELMHTDLVLDHEPVFVELR